MSSPSRGGRSADFLRARGRDAVRLPARLRRGWAALPLSPPHPFFRSRTSVPALARSHLRFRLFFSAALSPVALSGLTFHGNAVSRFSGFPPAALRLLLSLRLRRRWISVYVRCHGSAGLFLLRRATAPPLGLDRFIPAPLVYPAFFSASAGLSPRFLPPVLFHRTSDPDAARYNCPGVLIHRSSGGLC